MEKTEAKLSFWFSYMEMTMKNCDMTLRSTSAKLEAVQKVQENTYEQQTKTY